MTGYFITLEGIEGAGKTTLARRLDLWLSEAGVPHLMAREPGGTEAGEAIRQILLGSHVSLCPEAELLLMEAARAQLMSEVILPALQAGQVVILDRHGDSSLAYQGYGRGLPLEVIAAQNDFSCRKRKPDCTLLLDMEAGAGLSRSLKTKKASEGPDRFEAEALGFMERVRDGFLRMAQEEPSRFVVLPAQWDVEKVWQAAQETVSGRLRESGIRMSLPDHVQ